MTAYQEIVMNLPLPTVEQTRHFAQYVARAHSWYKHLPFLPPGVPFGFFLDPNAGRSISERWTRADHPGGPFPEWFAETKPIKQDSLEAIAAFLAVRQSLPLKTVIEDITDPKQRSHIYPMLTSEYRESCGCWQYDRLGLRSRGGKKISPLIYDSRMQAVKVPEEILERCSCRLTAFIHRYAPKYQGLPECCTQSLSPVVEYARDHPTEPQIVRYRLLLAALQEIDGQAVIINDHNLDGLGEEHIPLDRRGKTKHASITRSADPFNRVVFEGDRVRIDYPGKDGPVTIERAIGPLCAEEHLYQEEVLLNALERSRQVFSQICAGVP